MKDPKISLLMCVYNAAEFLRQSIDSVLNQTFTDFELLIGEDGSTDNSFEIISGYKDPRIRIFRNPQNKGIGYSCNQLIRESRGEYLGRHDSDDISLPTRLQRQMDFFEKHPEIGICGTNITVFGDRSQKKFYPQNDEEIRAYLILNDPFCTSTVLFKKPETPIYFNESLVVSEDYAFFFELSKVSKMANLPENLLNYRWHPNNITQLRKDIKADSANQVRATIISQTLSYQLEEHENRLMNLVSDRTPLTQIELELLEALLIKLIHKNHEVKYYSSQALQNLIFHQWLTNCLRLRNTSITQKIRIDLSSELFKLSSLVHLISWRNFRSFTHTLFLS